uniref:Uncharacterized protein n=1 Tax=Biomphalaria glabrata TaxID=6526 RepID=A0A2C9KSY8_BIOGL
MFLSPYKYRSRNSGNSESVVSQTCQVEDQQVLGSLKEYKTWFLLLPAGGTISIQNVIQSELQQLKKSSKVYHKQRNSDIFFLSTVDQELSISQVDLKKLTTELEELKHGLNRN